jgi:hypothetical protein
MTSSAQSASDRLNHIVTISTAWGYGFQAPFLMAGIRSTPLLHVHHLSAFQLPLHALPLRSRFHPGFALSVSRASSFICRPSTTKYLRQLNVLKERWKLRNEGAISFSTSSWKRSELENGNKKAPASEAERSNANVVIYSYL